MVDRNYVLDLMKSKDITIEDFNYDKLSCIPLMSLFTPYDITKLNDIATSLRYSAKPQVKYKEIDKIMNSRGFVKLVAGTNRICYRFVENDTFVVKVAYDKVGINDNPREFVNQNYLKPFCTKVFEVGDNGVIASFERVKPILSREEFLSIARDVFTLLDEFIMGEYVLDDCGSRYYMNYGLRKGFGPVLLDFTYLYKLDGRKLFCNRPDKMSETGYCLGEIDSSPGFNEFVCKKCGAIYRAADLAAEIEHNNVIIKEEGENKKMKVTLKGGTNNINTRSMDKNEEIIADSKVISTSKSNINKNTKNSESTNNKKICNDEKKSINNKNDKKINPIHFTSDQKSHEDIIKESIENIRKVYTYLEESEKDKCENLLKDFIKYMVEKLFNGICIKDAKDMTDEDVINLYSGLPIDNQIISSVSATQDKCNIVFYSDKVLNIINKNTNNTVIFEAASSIDSKTFESILPSSYSESLEENNDQYYEEDINNGEYCEEEDINNGEYQDYIEPYSGVKYYEAETVDLATIFTNMAHKNVVVINDTESNSYLTTNDKNIVVIDRINNIDTAEATIISSKVLDKLSSNNEDEEIEEENVLNDDNNIEVTVNGVPAASI